MQFELPALDYAYDALEPHIDAKTMETHHSKHHAGYTAKLNAALEDDPELAEKGIEWLLKNIKELPEAIQTAVRNNGGGFYNHSLFWKCLSPEASEPTGPLLDAINKNWGSLEELISDFSAAAGSQFGSGWAWLVKDQNQNLHIMTSDNQDNPITEDPTLTPILTLDVWEHAYYLNYQNRRPDYIKAWWKILNWKQVSENYSS